MKSQNLVMDYMHKQRPRGALQAILALVFTLVMSLLGFVSLLDDVLTDQAHRLRHSTTSGETRLFVVKPAPEETRVSWVDVLNRLQAASPALIVFPFVPKAEPVFYEQAVSAGNVLFGRPVLFRNGRPQLGPLPIQAQAFSFPWAAAVIPGEWGRLQKYQYRRVTIGGRAISTLEDRAVRHLGVDVPTEKRFRVDFSPVSLPNATFRQLLENQLPEQMLYGRIVVVSDILPTSLRAHDRLRVPGRRTMTTADFHAYGLYSLLENRDVFELPVWARAGLVTLIIVMMALLFQFLYIRLVSKILGSAFVLALVAAGIGPFLWVHFPVAEFLTGLFALSFLTVLDRYRLLIDGIRQYRLDFSEMVRRNVARDRLRNLAPAPRNNRLSALLSDVDDRLISGLRAESALLEEELKASSATQEHLSAEPFKVPPRDTPNQIRAVGG